MGKIHIPENAVGYIGLVAALKRVREENCGKLVVVREPAGFVTDLVGAKKPTFAWLAQTMGEPINCHGKPSRTIYVADSCLMPLTEFYPDEVERLVKAQAETDFKAALEDLKRIMTENDLTADDIEDAMLKAADQAAIQQALEVVPVAQALKDAGFRQAIPDGDELKWSGIHKGVELLVGACPDGFGRWHVIGTANSRDLALCKEAYLENNVPRGFAVQVIFDIWQSAFGKAVVPDCLQLGRIYQQHCNDKN
jgi:hypothetical protein